MKFSELNVKESLKSALAKEGITETTEVQEKTIPLALSGKDLIVRSKTGSGKTFAFLLPLLCKLSEQRVPQALVLTPTRELAQQIFKDVQMLDSYTRSVLLYGGVSIGPQAERIAQGAQIIIGTPGRILDHLSRRTLSLKTVRFVVLDEADKMLDMGFIEDVDKIVGQTQSARQTMLFSATMPSEIIRLSDKYMRNAEQLMLSKDEIVVDKINQKCFGVAKDEKLATLMKVLNSAAVSRAIVFCNTKRWAESLSKILFRRGIRSLVIHSDLSQNQRTKMMELFKSGKSRILIATDVASRGLHIDHVSHVINYDLPRNPKDYVHRIGRTGRAGESGEAINIVTPADEPLLRNIEREIQQYLTIEQTAGFTVPAARQTAVAGDEVSKAWDQLD
ncbi:DEAD/DEAH box helicase [Candidatus Woesearchaeota archaeon]|nr:DEAD/DEAH box helicase [Candidatus Woesearchaeota archaeon]